MYSEKYTKNGRWLVMELTEEEVNQVTKEHRELSNKIMKECFEDAIKKYEGTRTETIDRMTVALFEARCPKLFTLIKSKLQDKIKEQIPEQYIGGNEYEKLKQDKIKFNEESV